MKVDRNVPALNLTGENGVRMTVIRDNRGEPYRDGVTMEVYDPAKCETITSIFIEASEAMELRDKLNEFLK